jgi:hypothetical protein
MPQLLCLKTFSDDRGNLTVIEKVLPFDIRRIFYIYGVDASVRGNHRHHRTIQAAICLVGSCRIVCKSGPGQPEQEYWLRKPSDCLLLQPPDWHFMDQFSPDAILMVLASEHFDPNDYIFEPYA